MTGKLQRFSSAILPAWARKTPKITEVPPLLYLHGLSSGDVVPALGQFLGSAAGLSATVITRLTGQWKAEQRAFAGRDMSGADYVCLRADGIDAPHLVALVSAGATFINCKLVERLRGGPARSSLKDLDPQVLTIAHISDGLTHSSSTGMSTA